jgi:hypothetical protein
MTDLPKEITDYLRGERAGVGRLNLVRYIQQDADSTGAWSTATAKQWNTAIDEAIKLGLIEQVGSVLLVKTKKETEEQGMLF